jgi:ABC-type Mn2+/Zn2+ transport system permease subunit
MLTFAALIAPGAIVAYVLFVRPLAAEHFGEFYSQANGFWSKVWALCGKSVTLAFSYVVQFVGWALQWIDPIANLLGDPDLRMNLTEALGANPQVLGYVLMAISAITIAARLRSFAKAD